MTTATVTTIDAAHAAAAAALEELHAEAISALDALFRSLALRDADEEALSVPLEGADEPVAADEAVAGDEPVADDIVGPATLELPRRIIRHTFPVAAAA